ncbi:MAG TPA: nicotinate-nucleotide adenylyltransferase [Chloroflexota bacterium]|jgi:nicotinate-nucleotide adenylyltransferase
MKLGVLGGTFDPIHYGHLSVAEECRAALGLDLVLFLPAGNPPHKRGRAISPAADRVRMVELAIASNPSFRLSRIDVDRPGPSYTIGALEALRQEWGPRAHLWFLMGGDSLADLLTWHRPERLLELARIAATNRPGAPKPDPKALEPRLPGASERIDLVEIPWLDISASGLRERVAQGRPIKYQLPEPVEQYVHERGLYRPTAGRPRTRVAVS